MEKFKRGLETIKRVIESSFVVRPMIEALQAYKENRVEVLGNAFSGSNPFGNPRYTESLKVWKRVSTGGPVGRLLNGTRIVREQDIPSLNIVH